MGRSLPSQSSSLTGRGCLRVPCMRGAPLTLSIRREWPAVLQRVEQVGLVFTLALGILPFHFVPANVAVASQMAQG